VTPVPFFNPRLGENGQQRPIPILLSAFRFPIPLSAFRFRFPLSAFRFPL
jgi:hypothetical protein